ncbi:MAG: hypothetical protein ABSE42_21865 [Bryobacteraceae bacterium]|jgi:hypothetical protein
MKKKRGVWLLMLLVGAAWGADVTGKWTGSMTSNDGTHGDACVHLKQSGGAVTGMLAARAGFG